MKKKNNLDAHTRKVLSKILISNTELIKKAELIKIIKSDKGKFKGAYKYLIQKFHNDKIISCLDFNKLLDEITKFKTEALFKDLVIAKTEKLNLIDVEILKKLEPMKAFQYMRGFLHSVEIGNLIIDNSKKPLVKSIKELEKNIYDYQLKLDIYRNRKGKQWRDKLYSPAYNEYINNKNTDKTKALKTIFEKMPDKEEHRIDFELNFKYILDKFYKYKPS